MQPFDCHGQRVLVVRTAVQATISNKRSAWLRFMYQCLFTCIVTVDILVKCIAVLQRRRGEFICLHTCVVQGNNDKYPVTLINSTWQTMGRYAHYTLISLRHELLLSVAQFIEKYFR